MILRNRISSNPGILLRVGLVAFAVANLVRLFCHPTTDFSKGFVDGMDGVLFGIAITSLLMYLVYRRRNLASRTGPCA
jgi:hypothetical protein